MIFVDARCILLSVTLMLVSTQTAFSDTHPYANDVNHEGRPFAKVLTSFLKVPWINLNSSWMTRVTSTCRNDITMLFESADAGEMWALQMLDATSKIPSGILTGNIRDLGMYDECVGVKPHHNSANIQGRHCMVSMSMPTKFVRDAAAILFVQKQSAYNPTADDEFNFAPSLCLPSSCDVEDIAGLVNASIQSTPELLEFKVRVAQVTCSRIESELQVFNLGTILTISFLMLIVVFLVVCTVCDFVVNAKSGNTSSTLKLLAKFSFYTNAIKLLNTKISPGSMPAINGIRFLAMFMVVLAHRILSLMSLPLVNLSEIDVIWRSWLGPLYVILPYSLDTFLVVSGFLNAYRFLSHLRSGAKINLLTVYLHRYLRLTPCVAVLILVDVFIIPYYASGPLLETILGITTDYCRKNWWTNLLYIQNIVNPNEMCLAQTWYLAVEMQLFWAAPIILYPLYYRPKFGLVMLSGLLIAAFIVPGIQVISNQYSTCFNTHKNFLERRELFLNLYIVTFNRVMPYLIGIFLGQYIVNQKSNLTKLHVSIGWIFTCHCIVFSFWHTRYVQPVTTEYNAFGEATYVSCARLAWSLATGWIIYACTQGYGGPVTKILSLPIFVPLSKLGYSIYLVSIIMQLAVNVTSRTAGFASNSSILYGVWSDLAISIIVAIILNLCIESPVVVLERMMKTKGSPVAIVKHSSTRKTDSFEAMMRVCIDLKEGGVGLKTKFETQMSEPDFWQTVSADLITFGKRVTKSPVEWEKTWQDWKCDVLKKDNERETRVRSNQDASAQSQTKITILEKELLIFLVAVSCGLNDVTSLRETASQSDSCASRKTDTARLLKLD